MTRIVTSTYRYKRPPRKRKAVALEVPAIMRGKASKSASVADSAAVRHDEASSAPCTETKPANDDRKSSIVTIKRKGRFGDAPDLTSEEYQRRGDAADAMFREMKRRVAEKDQS